MNISSMPTLTILLYHGVTTTKNKSPRNYSGKHISADTFEEHMKTIQKNCNVLSMDEVHTFLMNGKSWPKNAVAVTFDDGFENNFLNAFPILKKYEIPATFYVCAGMINTDLMFWVDQIEDCIARTRVDNLELEQLGGEILALNSNAQKIHAIQTIKSFCKQTSADVKDTVIDDLMRKSYIEPNVGSSPDYRMMNWDQLRNIAVDSLFTIGGHTLYHDIMSAQARGKLELDIMTSIALLDYNLDQTTEHYAYPEGQVNHFNGNVISTLMKYGIKICPAAIHGTNLDEDQFHLKRIMPGFMGAGFPFD